jgi:tRNA dimethylallyltransferase
MVAKGALEEVAEAERAGASRTARAALGFEQLLEGDVEATKSAQRAYARRQLTWMRRMEGVRTLDRTSRSDAEVAREILEMLDEAR